MFDTLCPTQTAIVTDCLEPRSMHGSNIGPGFLESDLQRSIPYKILDAKRGSDNGLM